MSYGYTNKERMYTNTDFTRYAAFQKLAMSANDDIPDTK